MSEQTAAEATERNHRKVRRGYVVSDKMDKTVVVLVEERYKHSLYGKVLRRSKNVKVHDEANSAHVGDLVSSAIRHQALASSGDRGEGQVRLPWSAGGLRPART